MPNPTSSIPMQILSRPPGPELPATSQRGALHRSKSLPAQTAERECEADRSAISAIVGGLGWALPESSETSLAAPMVNAFLRKSGLPIEMREDRLVLTRHHDIEAVEAQRPPSVGDLTEVCHALMLAEDTPGKLEIAEVLLPAVNRQLIEHAEARKPEGDLKDWVKGAAKSYCSVLGGRDLAIDDTIAAINAYFFDKIGSDKALNTSNIAAASLTAIMMLVPTIGKNLPIVAEALREGRYQEALLPAATICAMAAMTLNPTMAAFGFDRASAIAGAAGNVLMMVNLPQVLHHSYEWGMLRKAHFSHETHPFTCFARDEGLVDGGLHTALDFVHEIVAQADFLGLNIKNAVQAPESARNPAVFPVLSLLLGSFVLDTARGDRPFADFGVNWRELAGELASREHNGDACKQAARLLLQQKIAETYDANYGKILAPLSKRSVTTQMARQLGGNTLNDHEEKTFLKGLIARFYTAEEGRNAVRVAIDRIYRFDRFDPAEYAGGDRNVGEILRFVQSERNKDKGYLRASRGQFHADHVYSSVIAHAIKCASFQELRQKIL